MLSSLQNSAQQKLDVRGLMLLPFVSTCMRLTAPPSQTPFQTPSQATGAGTLRATFDSACCPAGSAADAPTPSSQPTTGGIDRRGRQRITWQPPTSSQKDTDAQVLLLTLLLLPSAHCARPCGQSAEHSMSAGTAASSRIHHMILHFHD